MSTENETTLSAEEVALAQRATNPRTEQAAEQPVIEQPVAEQSATEQAVVEPEPEQTPAKPKKTVEDVLKGRVGHLTKTLSAKDQELETTRAKLSAAEALLAGAQPTDPGTAERAPIASTTPAVPQSDFEVAVQARIEAQEFNRKADEMYNTGAEKFTDWKDSVDTLVASGFMNKDLLDAAMAIEDGTAVLHLLGTN